MCPHTVTELLDWRVDMNTLEWVDSYRCEDCGEEWVERFKEEDNVTARQHLGEYA